VTGGSEAADDGRGPVIVLSYPGAGAASLQDLLNRSRTLCCTAGTGILPLCELAAATWRRVEDRDGPLTGLALASIRTLANSMIMIMQARLGGVIWCEAAFASPAGATVFLDAYPAARALCLHRDCAAVMRAVALAYPWGVAGTPYADFAARYPANVAATVAAYWAARTDELLQFETTHAGRCLRVRHEDLASQPASMAMAVSEFLSIETPPGATLPPPGSWPQASGPPDSVLAVTGVTDGTGRGMSESPASHLPGPLLDLVNGLQDQLGYEAIA
jgi:Sulfotransferase family